MKQNTFILLAAAVLFSYDGNAQNTPRQQADKTQAAIKAAAPGSVPATATGYTMRAKIDGKSWTATSMMPPDYAGRIIGYNGKEYIGFPYSKSGLKVGMKTVFSEDEAVDLATNEKEAGGMWGGRKGEMEITKITGQWVEAKFFFTATSSRSKQKREVTDGFFRIPFPK